MSAPEVPAQHVIREFQIYFRCVNRKHQTVVSG